MRTISTLKIALLATAILLPALGHAQALPDTVNFTMNVKQPTIVGDSGFDTFSSVIDDKTGTTTFALKCNGGASGTLGFGRVDEACAVIGNGTIKNPNNPSQTLPRINYSGGYTIEAKKDGYVNMATLTATYLQVGTAGAANSSFTGNVVMMPEHPSASAMALGQSLIKNLTEKAAGTQSVEFDTALDSIRFENLMIPNVGLGTASCSWSNDLIFAYANNSWQTKVDVKCGDKTYHLEGNMPLVDVVPDNDKVQEYRLNLVVSNDAGAVGGDPFAAADPFATVDGVVGTLKLENSGRSIDGVYENVQVTGSFTGTNVPTELTRGWAEIMAVYARTFFGA